MQTTLPLSVPHKLTDRQQLALDLLLAHGPLNAREWGRLVHAARGQHSGERFCTYCESAGVELGKALRAKGLVKRRVKNTPALPSGWVAVDAKGKPLRRAADEEEFEWPF